MKSNLQTESEKKVREIAAPPMKDLIDRAFVFFCRGERRKEERNDPHSRALPPLPSRAEPKKTAIVDSIAAVQKAWQSYRSRKIFF